MIEQSRSECYSRAVAHGSTYLFSSVSLECVARTVTAGMTSMHPALCNSLPMRQCCSFRTPFCCLSMNQVGMTPPAESRASAAHVHKFASPTTGHGYCKSCDSHVRQEPFRLTGESLGEKVEKKRRNGSLAPLLHHRGTIAVDIKSNLLGSH